MTNLADPLPRAISMLWFLPSCLPRPRPIADEITMKCTASGEKVEEEASPEGVAMGACVESEWGGCQWPLSCLGSGGDFLCLRTATLSPSPPNGSHQCPELARGPTQPRPRGDQQQLELGV